MKKLISIIILLCAIGAFTMSVIDIVNTIAEVEKTNQDVKIYEFCNKYVDWD